MDETSFILSRPKTKERYDIHKFLALQQSGSIADHCETMEEFNEEDIWDGAKDAQAKQIALQEKGCNVVPGCRSMGIKEGNSNHSINSVKIHRKDSCHEENINRSRTTYESSAPVNIPGRSQMVSKKNKENYWRRIHGMVDRDNGDEDDCGRDLERIPPHKLIARQLAQSEITSSSLYEGAGRTLRGRDLSRVRNAVLMRTGYIE